MYNTNQNIKLSNFGRRRGSKDKKKRIRFKDGVLSVGKYQIGNKKNIQNKELKRGAAIGAGVAGVGAAGLLAYLALKRKKKVVLGQEQKKLMGSKVAGLLSPGKAKPSNGGGGIPVLGGGRNPKMLPPGSGAGVEFKKQADRVIQNRR